MNGIRITERKELEGFCVGRYYPRRLKRKHVFDELSQDIFRFKKYYDVALLDKLAKALADVIRNTGRTFDIATHPPASRTRLYYAAAHLAKAVAVALDCDQLDCLRWAGGKSESQKKRKGVLKLKRLGELVECTSDMTNLRVLLIDDIITTGLTLAQSQKAIFHAGAESCFSAVLGWTISEDAESANPNLMAKMRKKVKKKKQIIVRKKRKQIQEFKKQKSAKNENKKTKGHRPSVVDQEGGELL